MPEDTKPLTTGHQPKEGYRPAPPGHNIPPSQIDLCTEVAGDISNWLAEHPVIANEEEARQSKLHLDRGKLALKDLEDERDKKVRPLNEQVKTINESYRPTKVVLGAVIGEISKRLDAFIRDEEAKRIQAAEQAVRLAQEAEARAREAEQAAKEAAESASVGELGVDIRTSASEADRAIKDAERAARQAERAERETKVKVGGGFSRATSLRSVETLVVTDWAAAIRTLGLTDVISEAIIKSARAYRQAFDELPEGIEAKVERKI